jgi:hypothetical protein
MGTREIVAKYGREVATVAGEESCSGAKNTIFRSLIGKCGIGFYGSALAVWLARFLFVGRG